MAAQDVKKSLTIVDRSTKALLAATTGLADLGKNTEEAAKILVGITTDIEFKQSELEGLDKVYQDKVRVHEADLGIQVKENKRKVLTTLLAEFGLAEVTKADLADLQKDLEYANREITKEIQAAVGTAVNAERTKAAQDLQTQAADHKVVIAKFEANEVAQGREIAVLTQTVADLRSQQDKDRAAQVQIAQARSGETTNVNVGK